MQSIQARKAYMVRYSRLYRKKNLEQIRLKNREYMRDKRAGLLCKRKRIKVYAQVETRNLKDKCKRCHILLSSQFALGDNGILCGSCIKATK